MRGSSPASLVWLCAIPPLLAWIGVCAVASVVNDYLVPRAVRSWFGDRLHVPQVRLWFGFIPVYRRFDHWDAQT